MFITPCTIIFIRGPRSWDGWMVVLCPNVRRKPSNDSVRQATLSSEAVDSVDAEEKVTVRYWCEGEEVQGEDLWWVLGVEIARAPRLWAGVTDRRPW